MFSGVPFLVEELLKHYFCHPSTLGELCQGVFADVKDMAHAVKRQMKLQAFFQSLGPDQAERLKLSEYHESCPLHMVVPDVTKEFFRLMPFKRHIVPTGPMNMVSFMGYFK